MSDFHEHLKTWRSFGTSARKLRRHNWMVRLQCTKWMTRPRVCSFEINSLLRSKLSEWCWSQRQGLIKNSMLGIVFTVSDLEVWLTALWVLEELWWSPTFSVYREVIKLFWYERNLSSWFKGGIDFSLIDMGEDWIRSTSYDFIVKRIENNKVGVWSWRFRSVQSLEW